MRADMLYNFKNPTVITKIEKGWVKYTTRLTSQEIKQFSTLLPPSTLSYLDWLEGRQSEDFIKLLCWQSSVLHEWGLALSNGWIMGLSCVNVRVSEIMFIFTCIIHSLCKSLLTHFAVKETGIRFSHPGDLVFKRKGLKLHLYLIQQRNRNKWLVLCDMQTHPSSSQPIFSFALCNWHCFLIICVRLWWAKRLRAVS